MLGIVLKILGFLKEAIFQYTSFLVESRSTIGRKVHGNKNLVRYLCRSWLLLHIYGHLLPNQLKLVGYCADYQDALLISSF